MVDSGVLESMRDSRGAGMASGGGGTSVLNIAFGGKKFEGFGSAVGKLPSLLKGMTGADPAEMKAPLSTPTPGEAIGTNRFIGGQGGGMGRG